MEPIFKKKNQNAIIVVQLIQIMSRPLKKLCPKCMYDFEINMINFAPKPIEDYDCFHSFIKVFKSFKG